MADKPIKIYSLWLLTSWLVLLGCSPLFGPPTTTLDNFVPAVNISPSPPYKPSNEVCDSAEASILTSTPCEPPCWQGLVPGVSTRDDVYQVLDTESFVDSYQEVRDLTQLNETAVAWDSACGNREHSGTILFDDKVVRLIFVKIEFDLPLNELFLVIGQPDGYLNDVALRGEEGLPPYYAPEFLWIGKGLSAKTLPLSRGVAFNESRQVQELIYSSTTDNVLDFIALRDWSSGKIIDYYEWESFDKFVVPED